MPTHATGKVPPATQAKERTKRRKRTKHRERKGGPYDAGIRIGSKIYYVASLSYAEWKKPALEKAKKESRRSRKALRTYVGQSGAFLIWREGHVPTILDGKKVEVFDAKLAESEQAIREAEALLDSGEQVPPELIDLLRKAFLRPNKYTTAKEILPLRDRLRSVLIRLGIHVSMAPNFDFVLRDEIT